MFDYGTTVIMFCWF